MNVQRKLSSHAPPPGNICIPLLAPDASMYQNSMGRAVRQQEVLT